MPSPLHSLLRRRLIFLGGKGGVGKTALSAAIAQELARTGLRTLWITIEDHDFPLGQSSTEIPGLAPKLTHLNTEANLAFEEYIGMKLGVASLAKLFVGNKLVRYLSQAAPGLHDLVLLGKIWFERERYERVVVDLPSTGYGISMFQSPANFARLFQGGPIQRDAHAMLATLGDPQETAHIVVAIPEEMPLQEAREMMGHLSVLFPANPAGLVVNRVLGHPESTLTKTQHPNSQPPLWTTDLKTYLENRLQSEQQHLKHLNDAGIPYTPVPYVVPVRDHSEKERTRLTLAIADQLRTLR